MKNSKPLETLIAEAKAIESAATPGPWTNWPHTAVLATTDGVLDSHRGHVAEASMNDQIGAPEACDNAAFIAYARTALPALIEALELAIEQKDAWIRLHFADDHEATFQIMKAIGTEDQAIAAILLKGTT
jgi:hypothetical protein